ncbi:MAG: PEGA domain-containing protein [Lachnospiraceae bacterium]|nr:PEGA domain-containing protein [Lachnospiraceae bacterium]
MQHKRVSFIKIISVYIMLIFAVCGCGKTAADPASGVVSEDTEAESLTDGLSATDTAVYISHDEENSTIRLLNPENNKVYEVNYDRLTQIYDRFGKVSVIELFDTGIIVDVDISVHSKNVTRIQQSPEAFIRRNIESYKVNANRGVLTFDGENYRISTDTPVFKGGKRLKPADISEGDTITVMGMDKNVYSIIITSGDGHVRLTGTEYFIGGWVQIGRDIIKPVTEEMIIDVPEGSYDMVVTYNGRGGTKHIDIERGKEITVDISDLKGELIKYGTLVFTILPASADPKVKIDGEEIDYLEPRELEYGVYRIEVEARGFLPIRENISVGQDMANIQIELTKTDEDTDQNAIKEDNTQAPPVSLNAPVNNDAASSSSSSVMSSSSSSSSSSSASGSIPTTTKGRLYIDSPEGAEVYYDGSYKGVVPTGFSKTPGTHVITLRKDGYRTKTYTVTFDDSTDDETYSFTELAEE